MDPLTVMAGLLAVTASIGACLRARRRARRAEAEAASLRAELQVAHHAACHDPLTGLPNRRAFYQLGTALVTDPNRFPLAVVVVDLDDFKQINDDFGHAAGDEVLVTLARRFAAYAGDNLVARLGGDEFAGLLDHQLLGGSPEYAARALAERLGAPMCVAGRTVMVTASVGVVPVHQASQLSEALRRADAAMYRAKSVRRCSTRLAPVYDGYGQPPPIASARHSRLGEELIEPVRWLDRRSPTLPPGPRHLVDTTPRAEAGG